MAAEGSVSRPSRTLQKSQRLLCDLTSARALCDGPWHLANGRTVAYAAVAAFCSPRRDCAPRLVRRLAAPCWGMVTGGDVRNDL
jgi:hypothetical protein